jgi:hypothetical protein
MRSARGDVRDHVAQGEVFLLSTSPASDDRRQGVVHCFCKPLMLQRQRSFRGVPERHDPDQRCRSTATKSGA